MTSSVDIFPAPTIATLASEKLWLGSFSWHRFTATQLWIFVLFLVYVTAVELDTLLGDGELFKILFTRRSSALKSTRRARIRLLVRLSRLIDAHPVEALSTAGTKRQSRAVRMRTCSGNAPGRTCRTVYGRIAPAARSCTASTS